MRYLSVSGSDLLFGTSDMVHLPVEVIKTGGRELVRVIGFNKTHPLLIHRNYSLEYCFYRFSGFGINHDPNKVEIDIAMFNYEKSIYSK